MTEMLVPLSTYRLQFNKDFDFQAASRIASYLSALGITHVYASPIFKARKGSDHGYDIVDPNRINPELGGEAGFLSLIEKTKSEGLGWMQDIVPNHMAFDYENGMLTDVLENGENSDYFHFFDIHWNHPYESMRGRVLAPFLGDFFGISLENGEIRLEYDENGFKVKYYDLGFPLRIESCAGVLTLQLAKLEKTLGKEHPDYIKFLGLVYVVKNLSPGEDGQDRYDQIAFVKRLLWELYDQNAQIKHYIDETLDTYNGKAGDPYSYRQLDNLLSEQLFRLSFWKVATEELNYRRFFTVNDLISVKVEEDEVFRHTHRLILKLLREGAFQALRIDHIDGLYDPGKYLETLRKQAGDVFIVVEKILDYEEELPYDWPVQSSTGYEFLNYLNGIFCRRENEKPFDRIYTAFTRAKTDFELLVYEKKKLILEKHMSGDVDNLAHLLKKLSAKDRYAGDITMHGLRNALAEVLVAFPVYRTYVGKSSLTDNDVRYIRQAVDTARKKSPALANEYRFIEKFLLLEYYDYLSPEEQDEWIQFVMRFQQATGPLTAKGFEDTVLYIYNRLISLNDVGGRPDLFGLHVEQFHRFIAQRAERLPFTLNATSTHDTKRGEDVRARINVLSELPKEWGVQINRWSKINRKYRSKVKGRNVPDRNDEYFFYQTLIGAFPFEEDDFSAFRQRIEAYVVKAVREAKVHTAWLKPDADYEDAFVSFIQGSLKSNGPFLNEFLPFQRKIAFWGMLNSLSQTLIKIASPGTPDFYQGTECWDLNLVDPDNRRAVDYEKRMSMLREIQENSKTNSPGPIAELLNSYEDGRIKLFTIHRALNARLSHADLFLKGNYEPMEVRGSREEHVVAFVRRYHDRSALAVAPKFPAGLVEQGQFPLKRDVWDDTQILFVGDSPVTWTDVFTKQQTKSEGSLLVGDALSHFPIALLMT